MPQIRRSSTKGQRPSSPTPGSRSSLLRSTSKASSNWVRLPRCLPALKKATRISPSSPGTLQRQLASPRESPAKTAFLRPTATKYSRARCPTESLLKLCSTGSEKPSSAPVASSKRISFARTRTPSPRGTPSRSRTARITCVMPAETMSTGMPCLRNSEKSSRQPSRHLMPEARTISGSHWRWRPCAAMRAWLRLHQVSQRQSPRASAALWSAQSWR
mmetsp:Transcript_23301/g.72576  ORF Transcript_23301/g.72576 Transcript_23301/m.72576 type:complete len:217 (-) Transcript_23301:429-1079(-)